MWKFPKRIALTLTNSKQCFRMTFHKCLSIVTEQAPRFSNPTPAYYFRIFGELNANVVVCLIDELFNILLSYYCHGIHTPPRCDIGEFFFPDNPLFQPDRNDLRPNGHKLFFPKVSKFFACEKIKTYLWKSTIIENIPIECRAIQFYFR